MSNLLFLVCFFLSIFYHKKPGPTDSHLGDAGNSQGCDYVIHFTFLVALICTFLAQVVRGSILLSDLESPLRIALAGYAGYRLRHLLTSSLFEASFLAGSLLSLLSVLIFGDYTWNDRLFVPSMGPNALGCIAGFHAVACLAIGTDVFRRSLATSLLLFFISFGWIVFAGLTGSRGAWLAIGVVLILFFGTLLYQAGIRVFFLVFNFFILLAVILWFSGPLEGFFFKHHTRIFSLYGDFRDFFQNFHSETSVAARMKMWLASWLAFLNEPLAGYGGTSYSVFINGSPLVRELGEEVLLQMGGTGGPHNEILAKTLRDGLFGFFASVVLLVAPIFLLIGRFSRERCAALGLTLSVYLLISSFTIEIYSIKHTTTFYAFAISLGLNRGMQRISGNS